MNYRKSKYNFSYVRQPNGNVIYNTYSKALVVLSDAEYAQYDTLTFGDDDFAQVLLENRILVEKTFDEDGFLKYCHFKTKFSGDTLHLILATTMDCNFGCPYCYENRRRGKMGKDVQDAIIAFMDTHIPKGMKQFNITWYGGEPLLYPDIIEQMSAKMIALAKKNNCKLNMYMVTNGYLLTPEIVDLLDRIGVLRVQITLDGVKEHHDATRHLRGGQGTFDKIFDNLRLFDDSPIKIDIRMNVDNNNCRDYSLLIQKVAALKNPNIMVYPSPVEDLNKDTENSISNFMSSSEFEQFARMTYGDGGAQPAISTVMDDRYCFCNAETENCYVIDELGECYKCWDQVGRKEYSCFNILDPKEKNFSNIISFMSWDPMSDEKCRDCIFLPICFGGCKFQRMSKQHMDCGFTEESLKYYIENTFFSNEA